jgi:DNA polymerase-3 subunit epsilon
LTNAHSADADTRATYEVLKAQLDRYPDLSNDINALSEFSTQERFVDFSGRIIYDKNDVEVFNFGKYKGQSVAEVFKKDPSYYSWIMDGDFTLYLKKIVTQIRINLNTPQK